MIVQWTPVSPTTFEANWNGRYLILDKRREGEWFLMSRAETDRMGDLRTVKTPNGKPWHSSAAAKEAVEAEAGRILKAAQEAKPIVLKKATPQSSRFIKSRLQKAAKKTATRPQSGDQPLSL